MGMNAIRHRYTAKREPALIYDERTMAKTVPIEIDCMDGCGRKIKVKVNPDDIIPHLGRPRGLRLRCPVCSKVSRSYL